MPEKSIPPDLQRFIARYIGSIEQLEILCLFVERPGASWSENAVLDCVQSSQESISKCLRHFLGMGFLEETQAGKYRFSPIKAELRRLAEELVRTYRQRRVTVVEMIYKNAS